jgi:hypothetical protein
LQAGNNKSFGTDNVKRTELKQFGELDVEDFQHHPVWIGCHTADYGRPWYEDTDEETFRPYTGRLPVDASEGMLLIRAVIELRDGSRYPGFVSPGSRLGAQQPQIFVDGRRFCFWGGVAGIAERAQREFYAALKKEPNAIFPLRFVADPGLATGVVEGQVDGFYRKSRDDGEVSWVDDCGKGTDGGSASSGWLQMSARSARGYPQPEREFEYRRMVYGEPCFRCGIFERQIAPFRFKKSVSTPSGFTQLNWVYDAFFVPPAIFEEIIKAGITGISRGPALYHHTGEECADRLQLLIPTVIACVETSRLPTVTCRSNNEEVVALRETLAKQQPLSQRHALSPELQEHLRKQRETIAAIPYCGRLKYQPPTALALIADRLTGAPDVFQTAEWFGSGGSAFRLTFGSERFAHLVRERRWKGLEFRSACQGGWSERKDGSR